MMTDAIIDLTSAVLDDEDWDDTTLDDLDQETTWTHAPSGAPTTTGGSPLTAERASTTPATAPTAAAPSATSGGPSTADGPFGAAALTYRALGWASTIPLPPARKDPPQTGWTGRNTPTPSGSDVQGWLDGPVSVQLRSGERITWDGPTGNIALRLPEGVVGIDVDAYAGKPGAATLAALEALHGPLPDTWTSTSRDWKSPRTSAGVRMFRVPPGIEFAGIAGPGIEVIQHVHRYIVAAPSVHPEGRIYRWISPSTATPATRSTTSGAEAWRGGARATGSATASATAAPPRVADLPELPAAWAQALRRETVVRGTPMGDREVKAWLLARGTVDQPMCRRMAGAVARVQTAFGDGQARHDATLTGSQHVAHLVAAGHTGGWAALSQIGEDFTDATAGEGREGEWAAMLKGAVANAAHEAPEPGQDDPCEVFSFAGAVIDDQEDTWTSTPSAHEGDTPAAGGTGPYVTAGDKFSDTTSATAPATTTTPATDPTDLSGAVLDDTEETTWTPSPGSTPTPSPTPAPRTATTDGTPNASTRSTSTESGTESTPTPSSAGATATAPDDAADAAQWRALTANREARVLHAAEEERTRRQARRLLDDEEAGQTWTAPTWMPTLGDDLAAPRRQVAYRVEGLLPTGANAVLTAAYKSGKTTTVNDLVRACVDGTPFLKHFEVTPVARRVAVFNYEVEHEQYIDWLREVDVRAVDRVTVLTLRGLRLPLISSRVEDWVVSWLRDHDVEMWVVDPFARAAVGSVLNENDNSEVGRFLDTLDVIKQRAGVSELVMPAHTGRGVVDEGAERARGATRLDDWADVRWLLTRGSGDDVDTRFFRATGRDVEVPEGRLDYDENTRRAVFAGGEGRRTKQSRDIGDAVLRAIESNPGINKTALGKAVGGKAAMLREAVDRLVRSEMIRVVEVGKVQLHYRQDVRSKGSSDLSAGLLQN